MWWPEKTHTLGNSACCVSNFFVFVSDSNKRLWIQHHGSHAWNINRRKIYPAKNWGWKGKKERDGYFTGNWGRRDWIGSNGKYERRRYAKRNCTCDARWITGLPITDLLFFLFWLFRVRILTERFAKTLLSYWWRAQKARDHCSWLSREQWSSWLGTRNDCILWWREGKPKDSEKKLRLSRNAKQITDSTSMWARFANRTKAKALRGKGYILHQSCSPIKLCNLYFFPFYRVHGVSWCQSHFPAAELCSGSL